MLRPIPKRLRGGGSGGKGEGSALYCSKFRKLQPVRLSVGLGCCDCSDGGSITFFGGAGQTNAGV